MDAYSSGEELLVKTRKPYTITKQRERWTDEEHNKFLEALKLYGRAWQRIEEYIGTKTAVQIRSHAQKFFSKIEKEAVVKGVPIGQAIDLEIPPPRPKRKPSNPYPRKNGTACSPITQIRAKDGKHVPPGSSQTAKPLNLDGDPRSEELSSSPGTPTQSPATATEVVRKLSNSKESAPVGKTSVNGERSEPLAADGPNVNYKLDEPDSVEVSQNVSRKEMHAAKGFPRHAPVQILDGSQGTCSQGFSSDVSYQETKAPMEFVAGHPALFSHPAVSGAVESENSTFRSSNQQIHPSLHPLLNNQGDHSSFLQMSSTFSSLILSVLLQNPAAYAAATSAASLWPTAIVENSVNSVSGNDGDFSARPTHPAPSMAAIAAATVAAATAWWAAHGLLPVCAPFPAFLPASVAVPFASTGQTTAANDEEKEKNNIHIPGSQIRQNSTPKSSATSSSSDSGNSGKVKVIGVEPTDAEEAPQISDPKDSSNLKNKQVDRSSCGSNTPSGSDAETDALGKNDKENEESKEPDENHTASDLSGRRIRIFGNTNDNWKEVSEEGRLAFQALFSKGRLPQSFSPPHDVTSKDQEMNDGVENQIPQNIKQSKEDTSQLDLNSNPWDCLSGDHGTRKSETTSQSNANSKDEMLRIGLLQAKLTGNKTGFKPYKRCSVEARENKMINSSNQEQGNCSKRLRLEEEAASI